MALYGKIPGRIRSSGKIAVRGLWVPQNKNDLMNNILRDIVIWVGKGKHLQSSVNSVSAAFESGLGLRLA